MRADRRSVHAAVGPDDSGARTPVRKRQKNRVSRPLCAPSEGLAVIDGAWTRDIIRYHAPGRRLFSRLRAELPLVLAKVLTQRLRELEGRGILRRNVMETSPQSLGYALTGLGVEIRPVMRTIPEAGRRLGQRAGAADGTLPRQG